MDSALLQRIVGAAVLVALGVIFIPALLDGSGYKSRHHISRIKPKPDFPPLSQKYLQPVSSPLTAARDRQTKKVAKNMPPVVSKKQPLHAFALQVGTFKDKSNAIKLRNKLRKAGYASFVVAVVNKGKKIYKVQIGPELEKSTLEKIKKKVRKRYGLDGYVVNH